MGWYQCTWKRKRGKDISIIIAMGPGHGSCRNGGSMLRGLLSCSFSLYTLPCPLQVKHLPAFSQLPGWPIFLIFPLPEDLVLSRSHGWGDFSAPSKFSSISTPQRLTCFFQAMLGTEALRPLLSCWQFCNPEKSRVGTSCQLAETTFLLFLVPLPQVTLLTIPSGNLF